MKTKPTRWQIAAETLGFVGLSLVFLVVGAYYAASLNAPGTAPRRDPAAWVAGLVPDTDNMRWPVAFVPVCDNPLRTPSRRRREHTGIGRGKWRH